MKKKQKNFNFNKYMEKSDDNEILEYHGEVEYRKPSLVTMGQPNTEIECHEITQSKDITAKILDKIKFDKSKEGLELELKKCREDLEKRREITENYINKLEKCRKVMKKSNKYRIDSFFEKLTKLTKEYDMYMELDCDQGINLYDLGTDELMANGLYLK